MQRCQSLHPLRLSLSSQGHHLVQQRKYRLNMTQQLQQSPPRFPVPEVRPQLFVAHFQYHAQLKYEKHDALLQSYTVVGAVHNIRALLLQQCRLTAQCRPATIQHKQHSAVPLYGTYPDFVDKSFLHQRQSLQLSQQSLRC